MSEEVQWSIHCPDIDPDETATWVRDEADVRRYLNTYYEPGNYLVKRTVTYGPWERVIE